MPQPGKLTARHEERWTLHLGLLRECLSSVAEEDAHPGQVQGQRLSGLPASPDLYLAHLPLPFPVLRVGKTFLPERREAKAELTAPWVK